MWYFIIFVADIEKYNSKQERRQQQWQWRCLFMSEEFTRDSERSGFHGNFIHFYHGFQIKLRRVVFCHKLLRRLALCWMKNSWSGLEIASKEKSSSSFFQIIGVDLTTATGCWNLRINPVVSDDFLILEMNLFSFNVLYLLYF